MHAKHYSPPPASNPTNPSNSMEGLAAQLLQQAARPGAYGRIKLATGLDVILHRLEAHRWRLALARQHAFPSEDELTMWRALVNAPAAAEPQRTYKQHTHPKTQRPILYHVVELTWREYTCEVRA